MRRTPYIGPVSASKLEQLPLLRRAPDRPGEVIIKRLVALEGDWLYVPGRADVEKIPRARFLDRLL